MSDTRHRRRKWAVLLGVIVICLVGVYVVTSRTGFRILSSPPRPQNYRLAMFGKWTWPVMQQWHRLRQAIFGPLQKVQLEGVFSEINPDALVPPLNLIRG